MTSSNSLWWIRKWRVISVHDPWSMGFIVVANNVRRERNDQHHDGFVKSNDLRDLSVASFSLSRVIKQPSDLIYFRRLGLSAFPGKPLSMLEVFGYKPIWGWMKLNVDGCSLGNPGRVGAGGVLRNYRGNIVGSFKMFLGIHSNYYAEFKALMEAILKAKELNVGALWIESDLAALVGAIQSQSIPWYAAQDWIIVKCFLGSIN
ncbi:uncharacterized protein LOC122065440 [Macadamia integrifolia]|uniref:uncharacterized protein LOC122065440 n=1 Tax=Macadamia integrifolia TaxID=60698 RepID=UPI001C4FD5F4|nr:uncharacterized protein LOC122065440 [Macadamia integrifolia]